MSKIIQSAFDSMRNDTQTEASNCYIYTWLLKKPDTFYLLQTRKELSRYAYFNNKTLESNLRKKYIYQILNMTSRRQNIPFLSLLPRECMSRYFLKTFFMYARPIPVQTKVQFKNLQFLAVTYDMGVLSCAFNVV